MSTNKRHNVHIPPSETWLARVVRLVCTQRTIRLTRHSIASAEPQRHKKQCYSVEKHRPSLLRSRWNYFVCWQKIHVVSLQLARSSPSCIIYESRVLLLQCCCGVTTSTLMTDFTASRRWHKIQLKTDAFHALYIYTHKNARVRAPSNVYVRVNWW